MTEYWTEERRAAQREHINKSRPWKRRKWTTADRRRQSERMKTIRPWEKSPVTRKAPD